MEELLVKRVCDGPLWSPAAALIPTNGILGKAGSPGARRTPFPPGF